MLELSGKFRAPRATREVFSWLVFALHPSNPPPRPPARFSRFAHRRRVSAICARNIASIIGQADSPLIKSGQDPGFFPFVLPCYRQRPVSRLPETGLSQLSSFLNLVTSDTVPDRLTANKGEFIQSRSFRRASTSGGPLEQQASHPSALPHHPHPLSSSSSFSSVSLHRLFLLISN